MRFPQDFIEKVRDANNIVEIIGQYTELKGAGHQFMGRCPFPDHSDKSPSFSVNEDNQLYHCFGCKKAGNLYTFLQTFNGLSFPEAVEYLARRASIPIPEPEQGAAKGRSGVTSDQKQILFGINRMAAGFFHQQLTALASDHPARRYLVKRGLNPEIVEKFRIGVALDEWQGLTRYFQTRKVPLDQAESLGLLKSKKAGRKDDSHFDLFRDRLMFPIFSASGEVVGFGGRTLSDALPKYVNSSESLIFSKGRTLYGLQETGKFVRAQDEAIVVEGYMDAIALYTAGIRNVVAILGTALTAEHAKILKRYTLNVKMLLDGDEAGLAGAERGLPILLEAGLMPKGFALPDGMDPDDYVNTHGADALKSEIDKASELFGLILRRRWMQGYHGTPSEKVRIVEEAGRVLRSMQNRQLRELYFLELSRELDVELPWVRRTLAQGAQMGLARSSHPLRPSSGPVVPAQTGNTADPGLRASSAAEADDNNPGSAWVSVEGAPRDEAFVLSLLVHSETLMAELDEAGMEGILEMFSHEGIRKVIALALEKYRQKPESFGSLAASLASQIDSPGVLTCSRDVLEKINSRRLAAGTIRQPDKPDSWTAAEERRLMSDYLNAIRKRFLKTQAKALASQLKDQSSLEKLEQFMNIQRDRLSLKRD